MEKKIAETNLSYSRLYLPNDDDLKSLNLQKEDGKFVFLKLNGKVVAYVTQSAYSDRYFLNVASSIMQEKLLIAYATKRKKLWSISEANNFSHCADKSALVELFEEAFLALDIAEVKEDFVVKCETVKDNTFFEGIQILLDEQNICSGGRLLRWNQYFDKCNQQHTNEQKIVKVLSPRELVNYLDNKEHLLPYVRESLKPDIEVQEQGKIYIARKLIIGTDVLVGYRIFKKKWLGLGSPKVVEDVTENVFGKRYKPIYAVH